MKKALSKCVSQESDPPPSRLGHGWDGLDRRAGCRPVGVDSTRTATTNYPVTRGSRVVLAYNVFTGDAKKGEEETSPPISSVDLSAQMQEVISQAFAQREEVCIQLLHQYPEISNPRFLKGSDRLMYEILRQAYPPRQVPVLVSGVDGDVGGDRERVEGVRTEEQMSIHSFDLSIQLTDHEFELEINLPHKLAETDPILFEVRPDSLLKEIIEENNLQPEEAKEDEIEDKIPKRAWQSLSDVYYDYNYYDDCPVRYFVSSKVAFLFHLKDVWLKGKVSMEEGAEHTGNEAAPRVLHYRPTYLRISSSSKASTTHK